MVGFVGDIAGGGIGDLIDKYGAPAMAQGLKKIGIDSKQIKKLTGVDPKAVPDLSKGAVKTWKNVDLLDQLASSGVKYNPNDVLAVTKTVNGKLVWLESGNSNAAYS